MRPSGLVLLLACGALLAACNSTREADSSPPTVRYAYNDRADYDAVARRAERHCDRQYDRHAVLVDRDRRGSGYEATFACR